MSIQVANIDLSAATVGTAGSIPIGQATPPPTIAQQMRPMHNQELGPSLFVWNESGCGLTCLWPDSRETFTLPAGQWRLLHIPPGETQLNYLVSYIIPNAPVSLLLADLYVPGEPIDPMGVLGNSPIGVSGNVSTSGAGGVSFIKNDGNAPATSILEATPNDQGSSSVSLNNDASGFLQVLSANILRKILNVVRGNNTTGKATIQLGDSGDATITTLYGSVQGGQPANVGALTAGAATLGAITGAGANSLDSGAITTDGSGNLNSTKSLTVSGNATPVTITNTGGLFYASNANALGIYSAQTGAAKTGIVLKSWTGAAAANALGVGTALVGVTPASVDDNGNIACPTIATTGQMTQNNGKSVLQAQSAGGGTAGVVRWEGTVDPGALAAEGDVWLNG